MNGREDIIRYDPLSLGEALPIIFCDGRGSLRYRTMTLRQ